VESEIESQQHKTIKGKELLSLMRSALAFQDRITISSKGVTSACTIVALNDHDIRNENQERNLEIILPRSAFELELEVSQDVSIEIFQSTAKIVAKCTISAIKENSIILKLPNEIKAQQTRLNNRFNLQEQDWADGVIFSADKTCPCIFKVADFSDGGMGLYLATHIRIESLGPTLKIISDLITDDYHFKGPYIIKRIQPLKEVENYYEYHVGLVEAPPSSGLNNKRAGRHKVNASLQLYIKTTNTNLSIQLSDVSISGFNGLTSSTDLKGIAKGLIATERTSGLQFKIIRILKTRHLACQLVSTSPENQIKWLNIITPLLSQGKIDINVSDPRGLVNLFFEAGASIANDLEYKRFRLTQKNALSLVTSQSDILIRWVNISDNGTLLGHHSTYRVGFNSWYTGDVVGGQSNHNRVDRKFFNDNFKILKDAMASFSTQQKILGSWDPNHPYWQTWRNFLLSNNLAYSMETCDYVTRNQIRQTLGMPITTLDYKEIGGTELFDCIEKLNIGQKWFLSSLDIHSMGNTSDSVKEVYKKHLHNGFKRDVFRLNIKQNSYLVVLSQLPAGISINPVFDCAFIFPLNEKSRDQQDLYTSALNLGSAKGYRITSLRFFSNDIQPQGSLTEFFVIDSRGLEVFK